MAPKRSVKTKAQEDILIALVQTYPCIWRKDDANFGNSYQVAKAWKEIAKGMNVTVNTAVQKWDDLYYRYHDAVRAELRPTTGSAGGEPRPRSVYITQLGFLKDQTVPVAKTSGNLDSVMQTPKPATPLLSFETSSFPPIADSNGSSNPFIGESVEVSDQKFFDSLLPIVALLNDEDKLDLWIDIMELIETIQKRAKSMTHLEIEVPDIMCLGEWKPETGTGRSQLDGRVKTEKDGWIHHS